jgi:hypothetical protein
MFFTTIRRWLQHQSQDAKDRQTRMRKARPRPLLFLEPLEDRTLLTAWTLLGPAPLPAPASGNYAGNTFSGRVTGIASDPSNANIVYIATAGGGIWKTTNAQSSNPTWTPLTDNIPGTTDSMGAVAVAPSNSQIIYAGTGEANNSADSNYGEGILVSTDGGADWTLENPGGVFTGKTVSKIVVASTNARIAYAAISDLGINGQFGNTGIYKTTDGGATWTNMTASSITGAGAFSDLAILPAQPNTLYAAAGDFFGNVANGIWESTNAGGFWTELTNFPNGSTTGRISLSIAPNNPDVIYAAVSDPNTQQLLALEKSTNGGGTWTKLSSAPNFVGSQGFYDISVAVDPTNSAIVYIGGSAVIAGGRFVGAVYESTNSGATWNLIGTDDNGKGIHADIHSLVFDASNHLLVGSDGGIYRKDSDPGNPNGFLWTDLNGNLDTIQFYSVALNPTNANQVLGGSQDNGVSLFNKTASPTWSQVLGGDGGIVRFSQQNANLVYAANPVGSFGAANFFQVSINGGTTWSAQTTGLNFNTEASNFVPPLAVAPNDGTRIALGSTNIYLGSTNAATGNVAWTEATKVNTNGWNPAGSAVDAIALGGDGKTIYASVGGQFASSSRIFVSTDNGVNWTEHDLPAGSGRVNQLLVDPNNPQTAYAVVNTFGGGHVFKTTNGGANWTNISGNLPNLPTWTIQLDTVNNVLYVGNDNGVYVSSDNGSGSTTWTPLGTGLPNAQVFDLSFSPTLHLLGAATHGRGMWEISIPPPAQNTSTTVSNVTTTYNSAGQTITLTANVAAAGNPVTEGQVVFTIAGLSPVTATISAGNPGVASTTITLPATLNQGSYTINAAYTDPNTPALYNASNSSGTLNIQTANSAVSVTDTNNPIAFNGGGETLDLTATVTSTNGGTVNEGTVVFTVNGVSSAPIAVSGGTATTTLTLPAASVLAPGSYPSGISVNYSDTSTKNYAAASGTGGFVVSLAGTTTTITSTAVSSTYNSTTAQTVTLTASVAPTSGGTINEGAITFTVTNPNGANLTATGNVSGGTATATLTVPAGFLAGSYTFNASYADPLNANFASSTAATAGTLTVQAANTTTAITSTAVSSTFNTVTAQTVTLTASVASNNGGTVNEGSVMFTVINPNGPNLTASGNVSGGKATATLTIPAGFAVGTYSFNANYADTNNANGTTNYVTSTAATAGMLTVQPPATTTTITSTAVSSTYNSTTAQTVTLTASVAPTSGGTINEGAITFTVTNPNGANLTANGNVTNGKATATLTVPAGFAAGTYSFNASYADTPNTNYAASTSTTPGTLAVLAAATTTTITSTNVSSTYNSTAAQTVMLTATVASSNGGTVNEGTITFTVTNPNGANLTANGNVANGTATATLTVPAGFAAGTYSFDASYADTTNANGITNYAVSTAPTPGTLTVLTVQAADTTTTITSTAVSSTYNSTADQKVTLTASVASSNGGTVNEGAVAFTVTNPNGTNLTASGNVTNGTATATLTVPAGFAAGNYTLSASYADTKNANGIVNYSTSTTTAPGALTVKSATTQTTITSTAVSSTYNSTTDQTVTLTAAVASADGGTIGEGKILFVVTIPNGNILTATADVSDGKATATLTVPAGLAAGNYAFSAGYADTNNANGVPNYTGGGTPASGTLTVQGGASQTSVAVASPVVTFSLNGQTVTVTATVASSNGGAVHEGNVTFTVNGVTSATAAVNGAGQAAAALHLPAGLALGTYTLTASYADNTNANGAINFAASSSGAAGLTIAPANTNASISQILLVPVDGVLVELVTVSVTSPAGPVNGGTVTLSLDGFIHQAAVVNGQATVLAFLPMPTVGGAEYTSVSYTPSNVNFLASNDVRLLLLTILNALDAGFALFVKDGSQIVATLIDNMSVGLVYNVHGQLTGFILGLLPKLP